jgi:alpha-tubulin suppressor-like RCC1 family protein/predicted small secreted protein
MKTRTVLALFALPAIALAACNLIVGVHDVKLRKDSGATLDGDIEPPPTPEEDAGPEPSRYTELGLGKQHSCAKRRGGGGKCWGDDTYGQTGTGGSVATANEAGLKSLASATSVENVNAFTLAAGGSHTCVALTDGTMSCWGFNSTGQLGTGSNTPTSTATPVRNLVDALRVANGASHTCTVRRNGEVACWGNNTSGQLGIGNRSSTTVPAPVPKEDLGDVRGIACGGSHSCAFTNGGDVYCWGENFNGQLGLDTQNEVRPRKLPNVSGAIALATSNDSTCAILSTGGIVCWGKDDKGQLGKGLAGGAKNATPVPVAGVEGATSIVAGSEHFCALTAAGTVSCWGSNDVGQLGIGKADAGADAATGPAIAKPTPVTNATSITSIGAGGTHTCAVTGDDRILCWGSNSYGELGNESNTSSSVPVTVVGYP